MAKQWDIYVESNEAITTDEECVSFHSAGDDIHCEAKNCLTALQGEIKKHCCRKV